MEIIIVQHFPAASSAASLALCAIVAMKQCTVLWQQSKREVYVVESILVKWTNLASVKHVLTVFFWLQEEQAPE